MNSSSSLQQHIAISSIKNQKSKKKTLPISINSNPTPGAFLFNNNISKIATSYKDIGEKIQTIEKLKKINQKGKNQTNALINNFLSINSKASQFSNNSILNKNNSKIISSRVLPAKNLSSNLYTKNNIINNLTGFATCLHDNTTTSKQKTNSNNHISSNRNESVSKERICFPKGKGVHKGKTIVQHKQVRREKSIGVLPSSKGHGVSLKHNINVHGGNSYIQHLSNYNNGTYNINNYNKNTINNEKHLSITSQTIKVIKHNHNNSKHKKSKNNSNIILSSDGCVVNKNSNTQNNSNILNFSDNSYFIPKTSKNSNLSKQQHKSKALNHKKSLKKPKTTITTNALDIPIAKPLMMMSIPYNNSTKNKSITTSNKQIHSHNNNNNKQFLTTYSSFNTTNTCNNNTLKVCGEQRKRGLSHGSITLPKDLQMKQSDLVIHRKNNHSISINRLALNNFIINNNNEKKQKTIINVNSDDIIKKDNELLFIDNNTNKNNKCTHHNNSTNTSCVSNNNSNNYIPLKPKIKINLNPIFQDINVMSKHNNNNNEPLSNKNIHIKTKSPTNTNNIFIKNTNKHSHTKFSSYDNNNNKINNDKNIQTCFYDIDNEYEGLFLIEHNSNNKNNNTNKKDVNNNILYRSIFENENIIYDEAPEEEDKFDNLNDVVRYINFKLINTNHTNIFSVDNNLKYKTYQNFFDAEFDRKVKAKLGKTNSTHKNVSLTGNKSSERKSVNNVSVSTQENSNKKYLASPLH